MGRTDEKPTLKRLNLAVESPKISIIEMPPTGWNTN
jgi:hypothetical protein